MNELIATIEHLLTEVKELQKQELAYRNYAHVRESLTRYQMQVLVLENILAIINEPGITVEGIREQAEALLKSLEDAQNTKEP